MVDHLSTLYREFGPPRVLQCDNGGEFKKCVESLCRNLEVKIVRGSPYHPQSQGKIERSHRSLKKKIMFDLLHMAKVGVNWASQLPEYQKLLNEEPMEALGNRSPFEVFYGRDSNSVKQRVPGGLCSQETASHTSYTNIPQPTSNDFRMNADRVSRMKANRRSENKVWGERYIGRKRKNNPTSVYALGETVLIRFPFSRKSKAAPKRRSVIKGKVIKRNLKLSRYKISFVSPKTKANCVNWVSVEDITSTTAEEEKKEKERSKVKGCRNKEVKTT